MHKSAGFLYGLDLHHLDHLAPMCSLLSIPLIFTNELALSLAKEFYPSVKMELYSEIAFSEAILLNYDVIFTCLPKELIDPLFYFDEHKLRKKILSIWLPHGNSDKDNLAGLKNEKIILSYGKQMVDTLAKKGVLAKLFQYILIGNFRAHFYEEQSKFYKTLLKKHLTFSKKQKTILYAPTWDHSNVEEDLPALLKTLPESYNLLIKLHPNTLSKGFYLTLEEQYRDHSHIKFISHIPTIYPVLEGCDFLITDYSSIAYDFLHFDRQIFFLAKGKSPIHNCGYVSSLKEIKNDLKRADIFPEARSTLYQYAFDKKIAFGALAKIIKTTYDTYFENELHFL
jgi:hypothetical protein